MTHSRRRFLGLGAALAVAPKAVLSAPAGPPAWNAFAAAGIATSDEASYLPTHFVGRVEYVCQLIAAGVIGPGLAMELLE